MNAARLATSVTVCIAACTSAPAVDAPFAGAPLAVGGDAAPLTTTAPDPQTAYVFERRSAP